MASEKSILDLMRARADWFRGDSWTAWHVLLKAIFGLALADEDHDTFHRLTGRTQPPTHAVREAWLIMGRRAGKSIISALVAVFLAVFRDYTGILAPGERGIVMVLARDRRQARVVFRYLLGFFDLIPRLKALIERQTDDALYLTNNIVIEIHTASFRSIRGYTVVGAILDEIAFWPTDDAANPDSEILNALRPAMATVPGALLLVTSSPYARRGELWRAYKDHFGKDEADVLVVQADTRAMNPLVPQTVLDRAYADDEAVASAEYGAQFRRDVESFVAHDVVDACVVAGRRELPPVSGLRYHAFVDPSGGSQDAMTLAVAHAEGTRAVLDLVREVRPPFSPESVAKDFADTLKRYGLAAVTGDRYGGEWPREQFRKHGVAYHLAEHTRSDLYRELLPRLNSAMVALLDLPRLVAQLCGLERRTARGGKDSIDHSPHTHDDVANAVAGAISLVAGHGEPAMLQYYRQLYEQRQRDQDPKGPVIGPITPWHVRKEGRA